jgi:hypothetical protein
MVLSAAASPTVAIDLLFSGATSAQSAGELASLEFQPARTGPTFTADFSPLGSRTYEAVVFRGLAELGRFAQPGAISVAEGPAQVSFGQPGVTPVFPPNPIIRLNWPQPVAISIPGERQLMGDTILLEAVDPLAEVLHVDNMTVRTRGLTELPVTGRFALPAVQTRLESVQFGDGSVHFRSDTLPGANYILERTESLGRTASWESLESFVGNGFSRSFSLPAGRGQSFMRLRIE